MAEAAYREWLKRKAAEPHTPRASPTRYYNRNGISIIVRMFARQHILNQNELY
uniref:Transposase n=1 Tax=Angiostrongylus cantonensis TaxID=6313 RepID=A0A0K0D8Y3_ANGCA